MAVKPTTAPATATNADAPAPIDPTALLAALQSLTPGQLATLLPAETLNAGLALAKKTEADLAREKFDALGMSDLIANVFETYERETWYKTDRVTKLKTTDVSGTGYNVRGTVAYTDGDTNYAVEVQMWVKVKGTAPVVKVANPDA